MVSLTDRSIPFFFTNPSDTKSLSVVVLVNPDVMQIIKKNDIENTFIKIGVDVTTIRIKCNKKITKILGIY